MKGYNDLIVDMTTLAIEQGKDSPEAWLIVDDVFWPNPHYNGIPVAHPESDTVFHPPKGPSLRERYENHLTKGN